MSTAELLLVTSHGRLSLNAEDNDTVLEVLQKNEIPWSAVTIYQEDQGELKLTPCLEKQVHDLENKKYYVYYSRNIHPFAARVMNLNIINNDNTEAATEYIYQKYNNEAGQIENYLKPLNPDECKEIIAKNVHEFIRNNIIEGATIVVGISGGGDSNALLHGLTTFKEYKINIYPVIIKGIPDWDKGVPRAVQLCENYKLPLQIMEETEVRSLLNIEQTGKDLISRFEDHFKGDDFEFLGTLLIRLALSKVATELNTPYICTGLNLEDLHSEALSRISRQKNLKPLPKRQIGPHCLLFPLWLCPKKIIDGCFPKYSLENYEARYPCFSLGRTAYYQMTYAMQSQFPGMVEQQMKGFANLVKNDNHQYIMDKELGFLVEAEIPFPLKQKFLKMLR